MKLFPQPPLFTAKAEPSVALSKRKQESPPPVHSPKRALQVSMRQFKVKSKSVATDPEHAHFPAFNRPGIAPLPCHT